MIEGVGVYCTSVAILNIDVLILFVLQQVHMQASVNLDVAIFSK